MGVCNCSMFCCTLLYVPSSIAIILMGRRKLVALLNLSSWCLVMVEWLFLGVPWGCLLFVIVVFPDHTHLLNLYFDQTCCNKVFIRIFYENNITSCYYQIWTKVVWKVVHGLMDTLTRTKTKTLQLRKIRVCYVFPCSVS